MPLRILFILAIAFSSVSANAQVMALERYPMVPEEYNGVFLDAVQNNISGVMKSAFGQYFGQLTSKSEIYGYGTYYTNSDGEVIGQFRNGNLIFGIRMNNETAMVGTLSDYIAYDLHSGDPLYIIHDSLRYLVTTDFQEKYRFEALNYQNGDRYVGETVNGKRDGYGIYYYAGGNYYYGQYSNNKRRGYGALFRSDNSIVLQYWTDEDE